MGNMDLHMRSPAAAGGAQTQSTADADAADPRQAALDKKAQDRKDDNAATPGATAASQLLGRNCKDVAQYVKLIQKYPNERDAILEQVAARLGNDFAKQVDEKTGGGADAAKGDDDGGDGKDGFDSKASYLPQDGKPQLSGEVDYTKGDNQVSASGSVSDKKNYDLSLSGTHNVSDSTSVTAGLDHNVQDGAATDTASLGAGYSTDKLAVSGELDLTKSASGLGAGIKSGATASLVDGKLYGQAFGGGSMDGDGTHYNFGGGLVLTPNDHTALTAAGVMDEKGGIDLRLQYDVFKDKVKGAGDLDDAKKNAMLSLFVGYKRGDGMVGGSPLDDQMGVGPTGKDQSGVYAGAVLRF